MTRIRPANFDPEVRLLAALADPTRLAIVRQLAADTETCACDFTACCDVSQPTVSHHLRVLREAGVVVSERIGQRIYYRLAPDTAERLGSVARSLLPGGLVPVGDLVARRATRSMSRDRSDALADA
jgi:DNA-binding transcriptional ArsR family regulator